ASLPASVACAHPASSCAVSGAVCNGALTLSLHDALPISRSDTRAGIFLKWSGGGSLRRLGSFHIPARARTGWRPASDVQEPMWRSEEHTSELQSRENIVCRLLLAKKKTATTDEPCSTSGT